MEGFRLLLHFGNKIIKYVLNHNINFDSSYRGFNLKK